MQTCKASWKDVLFKGFKSADRRTEVEIWQQEAPGKQRNKMQSEKVKLSDTFCHTSVINDFH